MFVFVWVFKGVYRKIGTISSTLLFHELHAGIKHAILELLKEQLFV